MTTTVTESAPSAPTPATAVHNVHQFTNTDPETRDDSQDPWRFEVSTWADEFMNAPADAIHIACCGLTAVIGW